MESPCASSGCLHGELWVTIGGDTGRHLKAWCDPDGRFKDIDLK